MNNIKEFDGTSNLRSLLSFWLATGPALAGTPLLTVVIILWTRKKAVELTSRAWKKLGWFGRGARRPEMGPTDIENVASSVPDSHALHGPLPSISYHPPQMPQPSGSGGGVSHW